MIRLQLTNKVWETSRKTRKHKSTPSDNSLCLRRISCFEVATFVVCTRGHRSNKRTRGSFMVVLLAWFWSIVWLSMHKGKLMLVGRTCEDGSCVKSVRHREKLANPVTARTWRAWFIRGLTDAVQNADSRTTFEILNSQDSPMGLYTRNPIASLSKIYHPHIGGTPWGCWNNSHLEPDIAIWQCQICCGSSNNI